MNDNQKSPMTDPQEMIAAITNLEQELRDLGWQPVEMVEEHTGVPFTRWFPPNRDASADASHNDQPTEYAGGEHP